ncbi:MAG TPA: hypothetical protein VFT50_09415 [Baekduia sp.]|nr:hypothetical protein [Baekduia sp.]
MTHIDREEVDARIAAAVGPILNELKWQRWLIGLLVVAVVSPKLGGPDAAQIAQGLAAHVVSAVA